MHYCFVCVKKAEHACGHCKEIFFCSRECQEADFKRIHRHEIKHETFTDGWQASATEESVTKEEKQPMPRKPSKLEPLREAIRYANIKYEKLAAKVAKAEIVSKIRRQYMKDQQKMSTKERKRAEFMEKFTENQEVHQKWQLHDAFDATIESARSFVPIMTGAEQPPMPGIQEELKIAYIKRQLSLLRLRRRLSCLTEEPRHINAAFATEARIEQDIDRFLYEWLIVKEGHTRAPLPYEEAVKERARYNVELYSRQLATHEWNRMMGTMTGHLTKIMSDDRYKSLKLDEKSLEYGRETSFQSMDSICTTYIATYDKVLREQYERGEISIDVWQNSVAFYQKTYEALRKRGVILFDYLEDLVNQPDLYSTTFGMKTGGTTEVKRGRGRPPKKNPVPTTEEEEEEAEIEKHVIESFNTQMESESPNWMSLLKGVSLFVIAIIVLVQLFSVDVQGLFSGWITNTPSSAGDTPIGPDSNTGTTLSNTYNRSMTTKEALEAIVNTKSLAETDEYVDILTNRTNTLIATVQTGADQLVGASMITTANYTQLRWDWLIPTDGFIDAIIKNIDVYIDRRLPGHSCATFANMTTGQFKNLTRGLEKRVTDREHALCVELYNYTRTTSPDERASIIEELAILLPDRYEPGMEVTSAIMGPILAPQLNVLKTVLEVAKRDLLPVFKTMKEASSSAHKEFTKQQAVVTSRNESYIPAKSTFDTLHKEWNIRRIATSMFSTQAVGSIIYHITEGIVLGNGLTRCFIGVTELNDIRLRGDMTREFMSSNFNPWIAIPAFVALIQCAYRSMRYVMNVPRYNASFKRWTDDLLWYFMAPSISDESIQVIAKKIDGHTGDKMTKLNELWKNNPNDIPDYKTYSLFSDLITWNKIKRVAENGFERDVMMDYLSLSTWISNYCMNRKWTLLSTLGIVFNALNTVMYWRMCINAVTAFCYTVSFIVGGTAVMIGVLSTLANALVKDSLTQGQLIGFNVAGILAMMASGYAGTGITISSVSTGVVMGAIGSVLLKHLPEWEKLNGDHLSVAKNLFILIYGSMVHPMLMGSPHYGQDYENKLGSLSTVFYDNIYKYSATLEVTPSSIYPALQEANKTMLLRKDDLDKAKTALDDIVLPDNFKAMIIDKTMYLTEFLYMLGGTYSEKVAYLIDNNLVNDTTAKQISGRNATMGLTG